MNNNNDTFPKIGEFGFCTAMDHGKEWNVCKTAGVFIEEHYEMSQPGHIGTRIRCVCAEHGSESTNCCIRCGVILHEWSSTHTKTECDNHVLNKVMNL